MMKDNKLIRNLNIILGLVVAGNLIIGLSSLILNKHQYMIALSLWCAAALVFTIFHGIKTMGLKNILMFSFVAMAVSLFFETMGANFGLFFSKYVYTSEIPGPKIFGFDVYSLIAYGMGPYLVWSLAQAAVGQFDNRFRKGDVIIIPVVAAFLLVAVDYATDPLLATIDQAYIWEKPGIYYGIPYQNYLGWYLMAYVLFQIISLVLYRQSKSGKLLPQPEIAKKKKFWYYPVFFYASLFIQMPFYIFNGDNRMITIGSGQTFMTNDIYQGVTLVYTGVILVPSLIVFFRLLRSTELE